MKRELKYEVTKSSARLGAFLTASVVSFSVYAHKGENHDSKKQDSKAPEASSERLIAFKKINVEYERNIKPIFDRKCADCHSSEMKSPWYSSIPIVHRIVESDRSEAKEHLEISKGFPFEGHGTPEEDLLAIAETVEKNTMPTKLYLLFHPSTELKKDEREKILTWVKDSQAKINKSKDQK